MEQQVKPEIEIQSHVKYVLYFKLFTYKTIYENYKLISCRY
jgi:hypothetical protein